jgi:hypothetical protein
MNTSVTDERDHLFSEYLKASQADDQRQMICILDQLAALGEPWAAEQADLIRAEWAGQEREVPQDAWPQVQVDDSGELEPLEVPDPAQEQRPDYDSLVLDRLEDYWRRGVIDQEQGIMLQAFSVLRIDPSIPESPHWRYGEDAERAFEHYKKLLRNTNLLFRLNGLPEVPKRSRKAYFEAVQAAHAAIAADREHPKPMPPENAGKVFRVVRTTGRGLRIDGYKLRKD